MPSLRKVANAHGKKDLDDGGLCHWVFSVSRIHAADFLLAIFLVEAVSPRCYGFTQHI